MIARVLTLTREADRLLCSVQFLDGEPLAEVGMRSFDFSAGTTNQQARADILAAAKSIREREVEMTRLMNALAPGTEYTI